jgi:redox-sensitive bicupin YhaK (pirin superfamily)
LTLRAGNEVRELTVVVGGSGNGQTPAVLAAPVGIAITPAPLAGVVISPIGAVAIVGVRLLSAAATSDVLVTVTSSDTNVATVQGSVFVHAGEQVAQIGILTTTQGAAVLTLKAGDQTVRFTVITGTPPAGSVPIIVAPIVGVRIQQ